MTRTTTTRLAGFVLVATFLIGLMSPGVASARPGDDLPIPIPPPNPSTSTTAKPTTTQKPKPVPDPPRPAPVPTTVPDPSPRPDPIPLPDPPQPKPVPATVPGPEAGDDAGVCTENCATHIAGAPIATVFEVTKASANVELVVVVQPDANGGEQASSVTVHWDDGTTDTRAVNSDGSPAQTLRLRHVYWDDYDRGRPFNVRVVPTYSGGDGNGDSVRIDIEPLFNVFISPLTITALHKCDWHSDGEYRITWDHGLGEQRFDTGAIGKGRSRTIEEFAITKMGVPANDTGSWVRVVEDDGFWGAVGGYASIAPQWLVIGRDSPFSYDWPGPPFRFPRTVGIHDVDFVLDAHGRSSLQPCNVRLRYRVVVGLGGFLDY